MENNISKKKKRIPAARLARRAIQLASFILIPGLFASTFTALGTIVKTLLSGSITWAALELPFWTIMITVPVTILFGRFFCGFFCSFGAMGDFLWFISGKTIHPRFRIPERADAALKYVKYGILVFCAIFLWTGIISIQSTVSPWYAFGMYTSIGNWPGLTPLLTIGGALLGIIMIGSLFVERFFCKYLCPLGAVYALLAKIRLFRIVKRREHCGACRVCTNNCSMGIPLYGVDTVKSGECINCFACMEHCPRGNVRANPQPAVAAAISVVAISGLCYVGTIAIPSMDTVASTETSQQASGKYDDGTYTGSGTGYRGETDVKVTVENGYITDITVTSYQDDEEYFDRAKSTIISDIISSQGTDVDTVSGATFSSNGIISAVKDALSTAGGSSSSSDSSSSSSSSNTESSGSFTDGTHTGSGTGFRGETDVKVTVENGKITDITVTSYQDDESYFQSAANTVISEIIDSQSIDVDTVSGATFSSNGIIEAVADALGESFDNPNSSSESGEGGHQFRNGQ